MKKLLLITIFCLSIFACQTAENTNVSNKNTNTNYKQNMAIENIRKQIQDPATNHQREINTVQEQFETGTSNVANSNKQTNNFREKLQAIDPENP